MGGGAYGPNLTGGDVDNQFPPPTGDAELFGWISAGVPANEPYGIRGISSGRMPHFGAVLTKDPDRSDHGIRAERCRSATCRSSSPPSSSHKGLWYPTILGVLVVVAGIVLFCGSIYVLLGTNLGARLGFLVAFTGAHGLHGDPQPAVDHHRVAAQHAQGPDPAVEGAARSSPTSTKAKIDRRPRHRAEGRTSVDPTEAANVKAAVDAALVTKVADAHRRRARPNDNRVRQVRPTSRST